MDVMELYLRVANRQPGIIDRKLFSKRIDVENMGINRVRDLI